LYLHLQNHWETKKLSGSDHKLQEQLRTNGPIPQHIAIIMDGNGRWAKRRGLPRAAGHKEGVNSVREIVEACIQLGVRHLTLYTFSTENWNRPSNEVSVLMRLLVHALRDERDRLHRNDVRLRAIGDLDRLPKPVAKEVLDAIKVMDQNKGLTLVLALSYSGRWDITRGMNRLVEDVRAGEFAEGAVTEDVISRYLSTSEFPNPDLLIRTGGEFRISNFLLWELAYSELYIAKEYWPMFRRKQLYEAIADFQKRERRFGMVSEQLKPSAISGGLTEKYEKRAAKK
jgi:undecaprenyl diphosphate synthase